MGTIDPNMRTGPSFTVEGAKVNKAKNLQQSTTEKASASVESGTPNIGKANGGATTKNTSGSSSAASNAKAMNTALRASGESSKGEPAPATDAAKKREAFVKNPGNFPDSGLKNSETVMLRAIKANPENVKYLGDKLRENKEFMVKVDKELDKAVENFVKNPGDFPNSILRDDSELMMKAIKENPENVKHIGEGLKKYRPFMNSVETVVRRENFVSNPGSFPDSNYKDDSDLMLRAIQKNPENVKYLGEDLKKDYKFMSQPDVAGAVKAHLPKISEKLESYIAKRDEISQTKEFLTKDNNANLRLFAKHPDLFLDEGNEKFAIPLCKGIIRQAANEHNAKFKELDGYLTTIKKEGLSRNNPVVGEYKENIESGQRLLKAIKENFINPTEDDKVFIRQMEQKLAPRGLGPLLRL